MKMINFFQMPDSYDVLLKQESKTCVILQFHLQILFNYRFKFTPTLINPWGITSSTHLHDSIFLKWYDCVRTFHDQNNIEYNVLEYANSRVKGYTLKFNCIKTLTFHLSKALNVNETYFTNKYTKYTNAAQTTAEMTISEEQPITFHYNLKTGKLTMSFNYVVRNQYGNMIL